MLLALPIILLVVNGGTAEALSDVAAGEYLDLSFANFNNEIKQLSKSSAGAAGAGDGGARSPIFRPALRGVN